MGIGFRLDWKWRFPVKITNSSTKQFSYTTGALQIMENGSVEMEELKMSIGGGSKRIQYSQFDDINFPEKDKTFALCSSFKTNSMSYFSLLMESLEKVEEISVDANLERLEKDILSQLGKLGALQWFHTCLSRNFQASTTLSMSLPISGLFRDSPVPGAADNRLDNVIVSSGRKKRRKSKRERALEKDAKIYVLSPASKEISRASQQATVSSNAKSRRTIIVRNESQMATAVKDLANLEQIKTNLEEDTGQVASLHNWAEAAGLDKKVLRQRLFFGWYCRGELLKSSRSLVMYLARSYSRMGVSLEDLLQAGNIGVLQGAKRFDHTRGYQFSTYVRFWIRKSMASVVEHHSSMIKIPVGLKQAIGQIQNARKTLCSSLGRYPNDSELARYTGLTLARISSARKCPRIVGSIDQKMGDNSNTKYMECIADKSIKTSEEIIMRQHVKQDIHKILHSLLPRERQVLILRYGFGSGHCKTFEEIGKTMNMSKEWIRRIEKSALKKARREEVKRELIQYWNF